MELLFKIERPGNLSQAEKLLFLELLKQQGQVDKPNLTKINGCKFLCIAFCDGTAIGIGAIKRVSKAAFSKAGKETLAALYGQELGYLFVKADAFVRELGTGKMIATLLLKQVADENVFASTAVGAAAGRALDILKKLGFTQTGKVYAGGKTKKEIGLFLRPAIKPEATDAQTSTTKA